jgi:hypothetical protein
MKRLQELLRNGVSDIQYYLQLNEGGGKGAIPAPVATTPPPAPTASGAATQEMATTPEEEEQKTKEALKKGTKSLSIPITGGTGDTGTVGTGTTSV